MRALGACSSNIEPITKPVCPRLLIMPEKGWRRRFDDPIPPPVGGALRTLRQPLQLPAAEFFDNEVATGKLPGAIILIQMPQSGPSARGRDRSGGRRRLPNLDKSSTAQACEATLVARPCRDSDCHQRTCRSSSSANTVLTWSPSCSELPASATTISPTSRPSVISVSVSVTSPTRTLRVSIVFALTT